MGHYDLGREGEKIAKEYLIKNAYKVIETNWRSKGNEVDIIAKIEDIIVIIEVKSRSSTIFNLPHQAVDRNKQRSIIRVAESYILRNRLDLAVRFDIITVVFENQKHKINHIKNAFFPLI